MPRDTFDMFQDPERGRFGDNEQRGERRDQYAGPGKGIHQGRGAAKLVDLAVIWHRSTNNAVLVSQSGDTARGVWLPKSLVEIEWQGGQAYRDRAGKPARGAIITLPEWKAKQAGLV